MALSLQAVHDPATDQNFRRIAQQFPITGGNLAGVLTMDGSRSYVEGASSTKCVSGTTQAAVVEISHGLGAEPKQIHVQLVQVTGSSIASYVWTGRVFEKNKTIFKLTWNTPINTTSEVTISFTWIAIG